MNIPYDFHGQIIGQKGKEIRQIMDECEVNISIPSLDLQSDVIKITGPPTKVAEAQKLLDKKVEQIEEDRRQRVWLLIRRYCVCVCVCVCVFIMDLY